MIGGVVTGASPVIDWGYVALFLLGLTVAWCGLGLGAWLLLRAWRRHAPSARYWRRHPSGPLPKWAPHPRHYFRATDELIHGQTVYKCIGCETRWRPASGLRREP